MELEDYKEFFKLVSKMRTAHWEAKKYRSKSASTKEYKTGLEIDQIIRQENAKEVKIKKEVKG